MKKKRQTPLTLTRETVRTLHAADLTHVAGGLDSGAATGCAPVKAPTP